jgi:hypothetical protein
MATARSSSRSSNNRTRALLVLCALLSGCSSSSSVPTSANNTVPSSQSNAAPTTAQAPLPANAIDTLTLPSAFSYGVTLALPTGTSWPAGVNVTATETATGAPTPQGWQRRPLDTGAPAIVESWQLAFSGPNGSGSLGGTPTLTISGLDNPSSFAVELFDKTSAGAPTVFTYVPSSAGTYTATDSTFSIALGDTYYLELVTGVGGQVFQFTGRAATWTAPSATQIYVLVYGAQGGGGSGLGGEVTAVTSVGAGQQLFVFVGGQGGVATPSVCFFCTGGFNGGGNGGEGGGGASDIRITSALAGRTIAAGGGAGGGYVTPLGVSGGNQTGGALQDTEGRTGGGGTSQSGGTPGNDQSIGRSAPATAGSLGQGGNGALGPGGGGGGGGWYGGGGGGGGYLPGTPRTPFGVSFTGGGGSSLAVTALWTSVNYRKGVRYGNGVVIIQILQ